MLYSVVEGCTMQMQLLRLNLLRAVAKKFFNIQSRTYGIDMFNTVCRMPLAHALLLLLLQIKINKGINILYNESKISY